MNDVSTEPKSAEQLQNLKKLAAAVYLCQALTFMLAGLPLLMGVAINFFKRKDAKGTWLESHFDWQVKTVWLTLAGFAISGFTLEMGIGFFLLLATIILLIYRITIGWYALLDEKPVKEKN